MKQFLIAYVKSMRLYYAFVTGIVGWLGVSYYQYIADESYNNPLSGFVQTIQEPTPLTKKTCNCFITVPWMGNKPDHKRLPGHKRRPH